LGPGECDAAMPTVAPTVGSLLVRSGLRPCNAFQSPRAWAFTLLGLNSYCGRVAGESSASEVRRMLAEKLMSMLSSVETKTGCGSRKGLPTTTRVCRKRYRDSLTTGMPTYVAAGLRSLRWLMRLQTSGSGIFRPVVLRVS